MHKQISSEPFPNNVVPLSRRNLVFVNRMIVTIHHRNNYSSSLHSSSLPSQLAGLCQLPQTTLPSQYLWILNESYKYCIRSQDPENSSDTETMRFIYFARLESNLTSLRRSRQQASKHKIPTMQNLGRPKIIVHGGGHDSKGNFKTSKVIAANLEPPIISIIQDPYR